MWSESFVLNGPWNDREFTQKQIHLNHYRKRRWLFTTTQFSAVTDLSLSCVARQRDPVPVIPQSPCLSCFLTTISSPVFTRLFCCFEAANTDETWDNFTNMLPVAFSLLVLEHVYFSEIYPCFHFLFFLCLLCCCFQGVFPFFSVTYCVHKWQNIQVGLEYL